MAHLNGNNGGANLTIALPRHGHRDYPLSLRNVEDLLHERDVDIPPAESEERYYTMLDEPAMAA